jgi:hypothetical protein
VLDLFNLLEIRLGFDTFEGLVDEEVHLFLESFDLFFDAAGKFIILFICCFVLFLFKRLEFVTKFLYVDDDLLHSFCLVEVLKGDGLFFLFLDLE